MDEDAFDVSSCIQRIRQRDELAASELVTRYYPLVIKIVRAHRSPRLAEEDLAQDIFLKIFAKIEQYRGEVDFAHWVSRVAVNTCLNALRALKARPELRWADLREEEAEALEATLSGGSSLVGQELAARDLVEKLLASLAPEDRLIISLLDLQERSISEASQITGWGTAMIKVRAFRARHKLRKALKRLMSKDAL